MKRASERCGFLPAAAVVLGRWSVAVGAVVLLAGCPPAKKPAPPDESPLPRPSTPLQTPLPTPAPTPPPPYVPNRRTDVGKIFNGIQFKPTLVTTVGTTALADREDPGSYALEMKLSVRVPKPYKDLAAIAKLNPQLPTLLPELGSLLESGRVSPAYDQLYRLKVEALQANLWRLDNLLTRHNFFDCETMVEMQHPTTKRRVLLVQTDMDTDTDGSDPDRVPEIDGSSVTFQPFTSYKWARKTTLPNSFIPGREARLKQLQADALTLPSQRREENRAAQKRLTEEISDLKKYAYLVAATDPYVVLPGSMFGNRNPSPFAPTVGDYCVVIYGDTLYPAIVGDVGPSNLMGEASLRLGRELSPRTDANNRAENDLKVTYLLFPGSADKPFAAPDLEKWRTRCEALLGEIGGHGGKLMAWEDLTKPKPPPATPAPATPLPGATPAATTPVPPPLPVPPLPSVAPRPAATPGAAATATPAPAPATPPAKATPGAKATPSAKATPPARSTPPATPAAEPAALPVPPLPALPSSPAADATSASSTPAPATPAAVTPKKHRAP